MRVNTLGDAASRAAYVGALSAFLSQHVDALTPTSRERLAAGRALRVLDSSDEADIAVVRGAPSLLASLTPFARSRFDAVRAALAALAIPHTIDERLVRGLDYYQHTIFEFVVDDEALGRQQRTVLAGGRYDGLVGQLGGQRHVASCGWAAGVERLALLLEKRANAALQSSSSSPSSSSSSKKGHVNAAPMLELDPTLVCVAATRAPRELAANDDDHDDDDDNASADSVIVPVASNESLAAFALAQRFVKKCLFVLNTQF